MVLTRRIIVAFFTLMTIAALPVITRLALPCP